jgi:hypothetical protein
MSMTKDQKINWVRLWLQKFGERDNEGFNAEVKIDGIVYELWLQYNYDEQGEEIDPNDLVSPRFECNNRFEDMSEEELDGISKELASQALYY